MSDPVLGDSPYPSEVELSRIVSWATTYSRQALETLFAYIEERWSRDYGRWDREGDIITMATGGWSGNEELIAALRENFLVWSLCWVSSHRGGGHVFEIVNID